MEKRSKKITWSDRVPPQKIRRLFVSDAEGLLDEDLLNEVGYGIYACCQDYLDLAEANRGRVKCRSCGSIILRKIVDGKFDRSEVLYCDRCSWEIALKDYHPSLLRAAPAPPYEPELVYRTFVQRWPLARYASEKLLLIDRLIQEWHIHYRDVGWPLGTSVVKATAAQMIELLEGLACAPESAEEQKQIRRAWQARLEAKRMRPDLEAAARGLGIKGAGRMRQRELIDAIERADQVFFETWLKLVYGEIA